MVAPAPPHNGEWLYEVKFDGYRILAVKNGTDVELWSRNKNLLNERFPTVVSAVAKLSAKKCIVDGEICALNSEGKSSFQLLQNSAEQEHPIVFYAFDLLYEGSRDLRKKKLTERKTLLDALLLNAVDPIRPSSWFSENTEQVLEKMREVGAEGAIAKRMNSAYEAGERSGAWIKIKFTQSQEFVVVGYTLPRKSRACFGALLLGCYEGNRLIYCGRVGTGFSAKRLREIDAKLKPLEIEAPVVQEIKEPNGRWRPPGWKASDNRWVKPTLVAQVQFTEWTSDGVLRHPSFLGLREDKNPEDVVRERVV